MRQSFMHSPSLMLQVLDKLTARGHRDVCKVCATPCPPSEGLPPQHVWCWIARYINIADLGATLRCCRWLLGGFETDALWQYHAFSSGLASLVSGTKSGWIYPFIPDMQMDQYIQWEKVLSKNKPRPGAFPIWVRIRDLDIRLLLKVGMLDDVSNVLKVLNNILHLEGAGDASKFGPKTLALESRRQTCFCRRPWSHGSSISLSTAFSSRTARTDEFSSRKRWPFRLRRLQWGGRPGTVLHSGALMAGEKLLLEWANPGGHTWPLPPHTEVNFGDLANMSALLANAQLLWAPHSKVPALLRVVSSLLSQEIWLHIDLAGSLVTLYVAVAEAIRQACPEIEELQQHMECRLMDLRHPRQLWRVSEHVRLSDLRWVQSETVRVEPDAPRARPATSKGSTVALLMWREQGLAESAVWDPATSSAGSVLGDVHHFWISHMTELRKNHTTENTMAGKRRLPWWSDEVAVSYPRKYASRHKPSDLGAWARQATEPHVRAAPKILSRQVSEPHLARQLSTNSEDLARGAECPASELDNDFELDTLEEHASLEESSHRSQEVMGCTPGQSSRERLVPHCPPILLPKTVHTRQFEFHPTLQDLILTGDDHGSVNVLNMEASEAHPALTIDLCPVMSLVWMRHHPQSAVCGAAHSGHIRFLKYHPNASPSQPVLENASAVEEFPELSSLSINCTDDYLLASGLSHSLSVYDVQTGKVLHHSSEVHEHFINISRFCNTSPHIFATASFDNTCKIWDLRQPIVREKSVKVLTTGSMNVMCAFSPDDRHILCSGVDTRIAQFEVLSWRRTPERFPLRDPVHRGRFRRSLYFADGRHFATAATDESHLRVLSVTGENHGVVDFHGVVRDQLENGAVSASQRVLVPEHGAQMLPPCPQHSVPSRGQQLVRGTVELHDADPDGGSCRHSREYVQSLRTHPILTNRVGVLLSVAEADCEPRRYLALVHVDVPSSSSAEWQ